MGAIFLFLSGARIARLDTWRRRKQGWRVQARTLSRTKLYFEDPTGTEAEASVAPSRNCRIRATGPNRKGSQAINIGLVLRIRIGYLYTMSTTVRQVVRYWVKLG